MKKIKVDVSVIGRFHAFNLAYQLQKENLLNNLFTSLPKFRSKAFGVETGKTVSCWWSEALIRLLRKLKLTQKYPSSVYLYHHSYMYALNRYIKKSNADVFIAFAGVSLGAIKIAKSKGMTVVLERGSSHRRFQKQILEQEYNLQGVTTNINFDESEEVFVREMQEYDLADYISIPSSFVKRTFLEQGIPEEKLLVNPYGVDLEEFKPVPKTDDVFRIIFAGGGNLRKGYHYLLQAFHELNLENCEVWHLGSVSEEVKPYLEKYYHKNWILKGHIPQNELYKCYSQGSVFVLPSIEDGFGMVIFQAMSCGLPVILSENTGGYDAITKDGEEGFVVPIRDVNILKEKILYLYSNKNLARQMGAKAEAKVKNGFTWDDYGSRYVNNLKSVVEQKNDQSK